jgi:hypothetical protein
MAAEAVQIRDQDRVDRCPRIRGIGQLTVQEVRDQVQAGGRFVAFEYCISLVVCTFRRPTNIYFIQPAKSGVLRGLPYTFLSLVLGWWGVPWGIIYTPLVVFSNFSGGCDVTATVVARFQQAGIPPSAIPFDKIWEGLDG